MVWCVVMSDCLMMILECVSCCVNIVEEFGSLLVEYYYFKLVYG